MSFKKVKELVRELDIKSQTQWYRWTKTPDKPHNIPCCVKGVYRDEWISWYDFLGKKPNFFISYIDAKKLMSKINIKSEKQYYGLDRNKLDLPYNPEQVYKKKWKNWDD